MKQKFLNSLRLRLCALVALVLCAAGTAWGETVTYTISSKNTLTTNGTAPTGSSATIAESYSTSCQMTAGNTQTLTLKNYGGYTITNITLSMKSNSKGGAGTLSYSINGGTSFEEICSGSFNTDNWYGSWSTSYVDVSKNVSIEANNSDVKIKIYATANSLYCQSYTLTYTNSSSTPPTPTNPTVNVGTLTHVESLEMWYFDSDIVDLSNGSEVAEGTEVFVRPNVAPGYELESISAVDASSSNVQLTENNGAWSFNMPNSNVTISATASEIPNHQTIDITSITGSLTFNPGNFTSSGSGYKDYNNVLFTGSNNEIYGGWTLTQVLKTSEYKLQMKANVGQVVLPQIVSTNGFTISVTATTNSVIVSDGTNNGTNELIVTSPNANITISAGSSYAVISQITITPANPNAVATPTFDPEGGTYTEAKNVTINCTTEGAAIYYTLDGSTPSTQSTLYESPIAINQSCVLKAIAIKDGESSAIATANYVMYIAQDGVFDFTTGVLNYGSGVTPTNEGQSYIEEAKTWTSGNVTLVTEGKYRWWFTSNSNSYDMRFYNNNPQTKMTISVPEGKVIARIEINGGTNFSADCGNFTSGSSGIWTGVSRTVVLTYNASSGSINVRNITVTYGDPATITLTEACTDGEKYYGTYSNASAFVVPSDLTVSKVSVAGGILTVTDFTAGTIIPANTGVVVSSATAGEKTVALTTAAATANTDGNMLRPTGSGISATNMAEDGYKFYYLTMNGNQIGFYRRNDTGAAFDMNVANKAYLAVPGDQVGSIKGFAFNEVVDGIKAVETEKAESNAIYNLAGQRVSKMQKGLYIVNGKKVLVK